MERKYKNFNSENLFNLYIYVYLELIREREREREFIQPTYLKFILKSAGLQLIINK